MGKLEMCCISGVDVFETLVRGSHYQKYTLVFYLFILSIYCIYLFSIGLRKVVYFDSINFHKD
jgi:hypothetical protein